MSSKLMKPITLKLFFAAAMLVASVGKAENCAGTFTDSNYAAYVPGICKALIGQTATTSPGLLTLATSLNNAVNGGNTNPLTAKQPAVANLLDAAINLDATNKSLCKTYGYCSGFYVNIVSALHSGGGYLDDNVRGSAAGWSTSQGALSLFYSMNLDTMEIHTQLRIIYTLYTTGVGVVQ